METTIKKTDGKLVIFFNGRLDTVSAVKHDESLMQLASHIDRNIIFDFTNLRYVASAGLRIFLAILKNAKQKGFHVYIRGMNDDVKKVFKTTGFISIFEFCS